MDRRGYDASLNDPMSRIATQGATFAFAFELLIDLGLHESRQIS